MTQLASCETGMTYRISRWNLAPRAQTQRVDVIAKAASPAPVATLQRMLQPLLAEHFKLALHWEPREMDVFALVVANPGRLGPRLRRW